MSLRNDLHAMVDTLFPVRAAPVDPAVLHERMARLARSVERGTSRSAVAAGAGLLAMMAVRIAAAWFDGRLGL